MHVTNESRGTPGYRAPELVNPAAAKVFSKKSDIWSMGCILYELVTCKPAFATDVAVLEYQLTDKDRIVELEGHIGCHNNLIKIHITEMLRIEPVRRPDARALAKEFTRCYECFSVESSTQEKSGPPIRSRSAVSDADEVIADTLNEVKIVVQDAMKKIKNCVDAILKADEMETIVATANLQFQKLRDDAYREAGLYRKTLYVKTIDYVSEVKTILAELRDMDFDLIRKHRREISEWCKAKFESGQTLQEQHTEQFVRFAQLKETMIKTVEELKDRAERKNVL